MRSHQGSDKTIRIQFLVNKSKFSLYILKVRPPPLPPPPPLKMTPPPKITPPLKMTPPTKMTLPLKMTPALKNFLNENVSPPEIKK